MVTQKEPIALGALVTLILNAALAALVAFDVWSPTPDQTAAVFGIANALVVAVSALLTRRVVWSPAYAAGVVAAVQIADDEALTDVHAHEG